VRTRGEFNRKPTDSGASLRDTSLAAPALLAPAPPGPVITVDRFDDNLGASACTNAANDCSLRGAVSSANSIANTTINLPAGTYQLTIAGSGENLNAKGDLDIRGNGTIINGAGAASTIIQQTTGDRVIEVNPTAVAGFSFSLSGVTVTGGNLASGSGGALLSGANANTTNITDCIFSNNIGRANGGAISNSFSNVSSDLTVTRTVFTNNTAQTGVGGAISFNSKGTLSVTGSTFTDNTASANNGGGINSTGGGFANISTSAFVNNRALGAGSNGGAIGNNQGVLTANYNRIVGNTAGNVGAGVFQVPTTGGNINDNWWGVNAGPGGNVSGGPSATSWLQLRVSSNPSAVCAGSATNLTADILGKNIGGPLAAADLVGLPSFPSPAGVVFSNPQQGTLSGASTQFVNGTANATLTTASNASGVGSADVTADNQVLTDSVNINTDTTSALSNQAICQGSTATFTTTASGSGTFTFVWKKGSTVLGTGGNININTSGNTSTLTISNAQAPDAGTYTVEATGECSTATRSASLTINEATSTTALADQTVCQGAPANFSTTTSGTGPFTYQWKLDGNNIAGATNDNVSISTGSLSVGSHTVEVTVNGACGSATRNATLTVQENTSATTPGDQTVCQGASPSFSTTASGTGPFTYQWKLDGNNIAGAINNNVSISTGSLSVGGHTVEVVVGGACGSVTKSAALTVQENTSATALADQLACQGTTASFSTTASGTGPFTYQWKLDGSPVTGATANNVSIPTASLSIGNHTVEVTVGGTCGSVIRNATLTVQENTSATALLDQTVCQGASASFSTTASGTGPFTYQWKLDGNNIAGATGNSVSIPTGSLSVGSHTVDVTVNGACGSQTRNATLTVQENTSATTPGDQTVCQSASASFSTTASGTGPFTYQWSLDGTPVAGATGSNVSISTGSLSVGSHTVQVTVGGTCGSVIRNATLTVQENTSATALLDQTVCQGASASFSTTASGTGPFTYQWKLDGNNIAGATGNSVSIPTGSLSIGSHAVEVTVSGTCGSITRNANLVVQENTSASAIVNQTVCQGASASFSTTASGTGVTYQWTLDGNNIPGATGNSVSIPTGSISAGSYTVAVVVNGACGSLTKSATLTVNTAPVVTTNPLSQTVISGNATFTAAASGSPAPTVQWQVSTNGGASFSNIAGATGTTLTFAANSSQNGYQYRAVFTNACGTATTNAATLTTCTPAAVVSNPISVANACVGNIVTFSASGSGSPAPTVQWQVSTNGGSTFSNISGATASTYSVTAAVALRNNQYRAVFTNACGAATSSAATLGVDTVNPVITLNGQTITLWPPNHKYHTVNVTDLVASVSDGCGGLTVNNVVISKVTSDEVENGGGDGNTLDDIIIAANCKSVQLRAERDGGLNGRVYTITFKVVDSAGNVGTTTAKVTVPQSQNGASAVDDGPHYTVLGNCP
jgi:hypothetical protein